MKRMNSIIIETAKNGFVVKNQYFTTVDPDDMDEWVNEVYVFPTWEGVVDFVKNNPIGQD